MYLPACNALRESGGAVVDGTLIIKSASFFFDKFSDARVLVWCAARNIKSCVRGDDNLK